MNEQPWTVEFYRDERGRSPIDEFIDEQQPGMRAKILDDLEALEEFGLALGMPRARMLAGQGLWELRTRWAGNITRIFYFAVVGRRIIALHGFAKKTQETPRRDLQTALRRRADYLRRNP